jgi:thiosulfate/3-mercaptopyruvate sulfurtransferase
MNSTSPLVSVTWLFENANRAELVILDGSLKSTVQKEQTIEKKNIPHAVRFDWDKFSDTSNPLPHTMPNVDQFTYAAQELGINSNSLVVVYDRAGIYASPRVWWMFLTMGFKNCYILDGGLPEWIKRGFSCVDSYDEPCVKGNFTAVFNNDLIVNRQHVLAALNDKNALIIDARSADRFQGKVAEPRAGLRLGHIPNSINIPFETVVFENKIRTEAELKEIFSTVGHKNTPLIFSCGSGVTACIDALAATLIGYERISVYDGSWSEWGMNYQ